MMKDNSATIDYPYIPTELYCPMTLQIFKEPVIAGDDFTYEKDWLIKWLKIKNTSPMTNEVLPHKNWQNNQIVKNQIRTYLDKQWIRKQDMYGGDNPKQKNKDTVHLNVLKEKVKNNFLKNSGNKVSDKFLNWLYKNHNHVFRYLHNEMKSKVLAIFYQASEENMRLFFSTRHISIKNGTSKEFDYIGRGFGRMKNDLRNYSFFIGQFGSIAEFFKLPTILMGKLLEGAYPKNEGNQAKKLAVEEKLQELGISSLEAFKKTVITKAKDYSFCNNICEILERPASQFKKIIGKKTSKKSDNTVDLFKLAALPNTIVDKYLIVETYSIEKLLSKPDIFFENLIKLSDAKLELILRRIHRIETFLEKGLFFNKISTFPVKTLELLLSDNILSSYSSVISFFKTTEIPIIIFNGVNPKHPALNWFLENIYSLKLTYKNDKNFKRFIDIKIDLKLSLNEWLDFISEYADFPKEYGVLPFTNNELINNIDTINQNNNNETNSKITHPSIIQAESFYKTKYAFIQPQSYVQFLEYNPTYIDYSNLDSGQDETTNVTNKRVTMLIGVIYAFGVISGISGETCHMLSTHDISNINKILSIGLMSAAFVFLIAGFIAQSIQQASFEKTKKLNRIANIIFITGLILIVGATAPLYFDLNKLQLILFFIAVTLITIGVIMKSCFSLETKSELVLSYSSLRNLCDLSS